MKIDAFGSGLELHRAGEHPRTFAGIGYDGLWLADAGRTAYLNCAASSTFVAERGIEPDEPIPAPPSYRDKWRRRW